MIKSCKNFSPKQKALGLLVTALILGAFFRFFRLGNVPSGYTWDEVAIAYDAWGIALDGHDHHGEYLPWVFESLGDFKAPGLIYLVALIDAITGTPSLITVRWVSAISGLGLVLVGWFFGRKIWPEKPIYWGGLALWIALSPWSILMSRVGFEANLALTLTTWGLVLSLGKPSYGRVVGASFLFVLSVLSYQSTKITIPLIVIGLFLKQKSRYSFCLLMIVLISIASYFIFNQPGEIGQRATQVVIGYDSGKLAIGINEWKQLGINFINHFHPDFLFRGVQANLRQGVPGFGVLTIMDLIILSLYLIMGGWRGRAKVINIRDWWIYVGISLLPSIVGISAPHALRAAGAMPMMGVAVITALAYLSTRLKWRAMLPGILIGYGLILGLFWVNYLGEYRIKSAADFQWGYQEAVKEVNRLIGRADKVYFTDQYGQPYVYVLWYSKIKPSEFLAGGLANYQFGPINESYLNEPGVIVVAGSNELINSSKKPTALIKQPDTERVTFRVYSTLNEIQ